MTSDPTERDTMIAAAWYHGKLNYKLHKAQRKINKAFLLSSGKLFVGNCSRQLGKTYWCVKIAEEFARTIPRAQIRYGAAFQSDLLDYIIPAFQKAEEDCPDWMRSQYLKSGNKLLFQNGSIIKLVGLDKNPNGLRGNTLDLIILDEVGFVSNLDYIYKSIIVPATLHRPNAKVIMVSTPPATPAHEFLDYVQKAKLEGSYAEFTIDDNPMVDEQQKQNMIKEVGGMASSTCQRELYCKFVVDSNLQLCPEWKEAYEIDVERDEYHTYYHKYVAMDLGRKDHTALVFGYYDFKNARLVVEDELTMLGNEWNTINLKDDVFEKEQELWGDQTPYRRISDNNNEHLIIDLASIHKLSFSMTDKESLEAMVNEVRIMCAQGRILVHTKCKQLIGCLKYGIWDEKRKEFNRSKSYGHYDMFAALVYLVRNLNKGYNPIPKTHGIDPTKGWHGNLDRRNVSQDAKVISNMFNQGRFSK